MKNYDTMLRINQRVCEEKLALALETINHMLESGECISIVSLTKATGLSRSYFYKNEQVNRALQDALYMQQGKILPSRRDTSLNAALKEALRLQREEISSLRMERSKLRSKLHDLENEIQNNRDFETIAKM